MEVTRLLDDCQKIMHRLCIEIGERSVGSPGNREATRFFEQKAALAGWEVEALPFDAMDWKAGGASLQSGGESFEVFPSPYSLGCQVEAQLLAAESAAELEAQLVAAGSAAELEAKIVAAGSAAELEGAGIRGRLLLLHGDIAREQLMPKNFVFYNPEEHQRIIALLEKGEPAAILCATGRNSSLAGGAYPFPLIEDGDFDIPSVYMTEEEGKRLLPFAGRQASLVSRSVRLPGKAYNVTARKGNPAGKRIIVSAHIDAKKGTPGAIDNATGVAVLLLMAEILRDYPGPYSIELAAFNGEDYYAVPGQMLFLENNQGRLQEILLDINIDGAGYREGGSAISFYGVPDELAIKIKSGLSGFPGISEGSPWYQGDHSIFLQNGVPAVAVTSAWFSENVDSQDITHTPKDNLGIVNCASVVEVARALAQVIRDL